MGISGETRSRRPPVEQRAQTRAATLFSGLVFCFWVVSALSRATEWDRLGRAYAWELPWVMEGTSLIFMLPLFYLVAAFETRWPVSPGERTAKLVAHIVGSILFAATHILLMALSRELIWALFYDSEYTYLRNPLADLLYDYRKDAVTYLTALMLLTLSRNLERAHEEAQAAREDAVRSRRITLKCGGRTVFLEASRFEAARADGNYAHVHTTGGETLHARISLTELGRLLGSAGEDVRRVHKSWIVNLNQIEERAATRQGDRVYTTTSGRRIPGSRRYDPLDPTVPDHPG
ncbi:LytR/AlgR family response regulator transcription factor [Maricaulis sp. CAU 1757]